MRFVCRGHELNVALKDGRATQELAPGTCYLATPELSPSNGSRELVLHSAEKRTVHLTVPKLKKAPK